MIRISQRPDDLAGVDDFLAEHAFARRALQRHLASAPSTQCRRRFIHPREPLRFDTRRFIVIDACRCLLSMGHDDGCFCEHKIECRVYRVDAGGREHYATRPLDGGPR